MKNFIIYLFVLLISNIYAQCDDYNEFNCSNDDSCDWVEDIDWGSCEDLDPIWNVAFFCDDLSTNSDNCYTYTCYGGGYGQWSTCCGGDPYIIADNSYCEEVEMPECSEMNELECSGDDSCDWTENIETVTCASLVWDEELCEAAPECTYSCWDDGGYLGWCEPECTGGMTYIDNGYCQEIEYQLGDLNQDSVINIQDVIIIINLILNGEFDLVADVNLDSTVNILDVIQLVNVILNN